MNDKQNKFIDFKIIINDQEVRRAEKKFKAELAREKLSGVFTEEKPFLSQEEKKKRREEIYRLKKEFLEEKQLISEYGLRTGLSKEDTLKQLSEVKNELERIRIGLGMPENEIKEAEIKEKALQRIRNKVIQA